MPKTPSDEKPPLTVVPRQSTVEGLDPKRGLTTKLSEILSLVGTVPKLGKNKAQGYEFARESDLADMIRPLLAERHLFLHQGVVEHEIKSLYESRSGLTMWLTILHVAFVWHDGDTDQKTDPAVFIGYGADSGDKGAYKAATGAEKYFLMKTFLVSTGDDPEADEKVDKEAEVAGAARGSRMANRAKPTEQAGTVRGGRSTKTSNPQLAEMGRLARELQWDTAKLAAFVGKVVGEDLASLDPAAFGEHMNTMAAEDMGKVIVALTEASAPAEEDNDDLDITGDATNEPASPDPGGASAG